MSVSGCLLPPNRRAYARRSLGPDAPMALGTRTALTVGELRHQQQEDPLRRAVPRAAVALVSPHPTIQHSRQVRALAENGPAWMSHAAVQSLELLRVRRLRPKLRVHPAC